MTAVCCAVLCCAPAVAAAMLLSVFMLLEAHIGFVLVNTTTLESHGGVCPPLTSH